MLRHTEYLFVTKHLINYATGAVLLSIAEVTRSVTLAVKGFVQPNELRKAQFQWREITRHGLQKSKCEVLRLA